MPKNLATCQACLDKKEDKPFIVPWGDNIGPQLMKQHYRDNHPEIRLVYGDRS